MKQDQKCWFPEISMEALGYHIHRIFHLFRKEMGRVLSPYDITPEQWILLRVLKCEGKPLSQNDISCESMVDKHSVSRMISRLEEQGYIHRSPSPHDRRAYEISLTEKGTELEEQTVAAMKAHMNSKVIEPFGEKKLQEILPLLQDLRGILEKEPGAPGMN